MPFNLGSLGFLTPFLFTKYVCQLNKLFDGELESTNRMRLLCTIYRYHREPSKDDGDQETAWMRKTYEKAATDSSSDANYSEDKVMCYTTISEQSVHVLNELVVDRGPNSNISMLELFGGERHLTTVQADGLCIATATGSTAYSVIIHYVNG